MAESFAGQEGLVASSIRLKRLEEDQRETRRLVESNNAAIYSKLEKFEETHRKERYAIIMALIMALSSSINMVYQLAKSKSPTTQETKSVVSTK